MNNLEKANSIKTKDLIKVEKIDKIIRIEDVIEATEIYNKVCSKINITKENNYFTLLGYIYKLGKIKGIREERIKRKK